MEAESRPRLAVLYDELAEIESDLEWALLEIRMTTGEDCSGLERAGAAVVRLSAIVAALAPGEGEKRAGSTH